MRTSSLTEEQFEVHNKDSLKSMTEILLLTAAGFIGFAGIQRLLTLEIALGVIYYLSGETVLDRHYSRPETVAKLAHFIKSKPNCFNLLRYSNFFNPHYQLDNSGMKKFESLEYFCNLAFATVSTW